MSRYGGPEVLEVAEAPRPAPAADQVLVRVAYAGVNFADVTLRRSGEAAPQPLPLVPGLEAAGIVEAIGPSVTGLQVGQRVAALSWSLGAYAEWLCTSAALAFPLPEDMALADGAAILLQGVTCHYLLHDAFAVGPGSTVLVHAAAGGMGTLLCQWASRLGARVLGTVSTPAKAEVARAAGAEQVVLYERDDFLEAVRAWTGGEGVDYVIDGVGRATLDRSLEAVAVRGTVSFYGWASGTPEPLDPRALLKRSVVLRGGNVMNALSPASQGQARARSVFDAVRAGWLRPLVGDILPLAEAERAHRRLEARVTSGKSLLRI